jgi:hypothetical protein
MQGSIFTYLTSLSLWLGVFLYLFAIGTFYVISKYPDPVKNKNLDEKSKAKLALRQFFRGLFVKYFIIAFGIWALVKNGYSFKMIFIGVVAALLVQRVLVGIAILFLRGK